MPGSESDLVLEVLHWNQALLYFFLWGAQGWLLAHASLASSARLPWICGCGLGPWVLSGQGLLCQTHLPSVGENFLDSTG